MTCRQARGAKTEPPFATGGIVADQPPAIVGERCCETTVSSAVAEELHRRHVEAMGTDRPVSIVVTAMSPGAAAALARSDFGRRFAKEAIRDGRI